MSVRGQERLRATGRAEGLRVCGTAGASPRKDGIACAVAQGTAVATLWVAFGVSLAILKLQGEAALQVGACIVRGVKTRYMAR